MMAVGASIGERIKHLKERKNVKDTELAKVLHIDRATLKRIIEGGTEKVSSQVIIDAAQHFGVSTDFLLGLTDMPDPMNHPVESFGLTEGAARAILSEEVNIGMLNRLLENLRFCQLTQTMAYALEPDQTVGVMTYDNILAHGESLFLEYMVPSVKIKRELKKDSQKIAAKVIDPNTVGNGQMLEEFRAVIQQIRKDMKMEKPVSVPVTREFLREMDKEILARAGGERKNISPRIVAEVLTDKSMVANICTPDQRRKFIDLMEDILITYRGEDDGAVMQLLRQNRAYIVEQMTEMKFRYHPYWQEMIEWGEAGILSSIQDYDPSYGTTFLTFATYRIETELRDFLHSIRMAYMENYYPDDEDSEGTGQGKSCVFGLPGIAAA